MEKQDEVVIPRYEFRAFAPQFGPVLDAVRQRSVCSGITESKDIYLVTTDNKTHNIKIRENQLDVKVLIGVEQGLEQWRPQTKRDFPTDTAYLHEDVFSHLKVQKPSLPEGQIEMETFIQEILWPHKELLLAQIFKRRFFFSINDCRTEITDIRVNGASMQTIAVENENPEAVLAALQRIGLNKFENVNYLLAMQRLMGMVPLPRPYWKIDQGGENG